LNKNTNKNNGNNMTRKEIAEWKASNRPRIADECGYKEVGTSAYDAYVLLKNMDNETVTTVAKLRGPGYGNTFLPRLGKTLGVDWDENATDKTIAGKLTKAIKEKTGKTVRGLDKHSVRDIFNDGGGVYRVEASRVEEFLRFEWTAMYSWDVFKDEKRVV